MLSKLQPVKSINRLVGINAKMPLRYVLIVPFILQICGAVGLVGYLSYQNGQKVVKELANQLENEICDRIQQHLDQYLTTPKQINQINLDAIELDLINLSDFKTTGNYFWKQMQVFNFGYNSFANSKGKFIGIERLDNGTLLINEVTKKHGIGKLHVYNSDLKGNRRQLQQVKNYDPRVEAWYADAVKIGKPVWSQIYQWEDKPELLSISSSYHVYDKTHKLIGVISVDLILSQISNFLANLNTEKSGKTFILERSGLIVASSTTEPPYTIINGQIKRRAALDSQNSLIRLITQSLIKRFGSLELMTGKQQLNFTADGMRYFVQVKNWRDELGLDWLIVVVIPESKFMGQINANTRITILLCIIAFLMATIIGTLTAQCVIKPILQLNISAKKIAKGEWEQIPEIQRSDELGELAKSFEIAEYNRILEAQVKKRTEDLQQAIEQLQTTQQELIQSQKIAAQEQQAAVREAARSAAANLAKSEFLANMSHELRTPLNAILGFTQFISRDYSLCGEHQENLAIINRAGEHLLNLINDILEMSKIEAGKITLNSSSFDLIYVLKNLREMLHLRAASKNLELVFEYAQNIPKYIETDEHKLYQVLLNLLGNAIKFTNTGRVTLRVRLGAGEWETGEQGEQNFPHPPHLFFEVQDTGCGITPQEIDLLFEAFEQTEIGRKSQQGTGLGLAISRKYVQLMGGDITVSSMPGVGSTFAFHVQIALTCPREIPTNQINYQILALAPTEKAYRILVVDDSKESRLLLVKILTSVGFEVREATDGAEAVANWESWQPHLIFMDMRMPVMDGYEATRIIKAKQIGYGADNTLRRFPKLKQLVSLRSQYLAGGFPDSGGCEVLKVSPLFKSQLRAVSPTLEATGSIRNDVSGVSAKRSLTALALPSEFSGTEQGSSNTHTIIIALTASAFEEERQKILSIGCDDFIRKPFTQEVLLEKLSQHLGVKYTNQVETTNTTVVDESTQIFVSVAELLSRLSQMSPEWLQHLYYAAASCSDELILELLKQIPSENGQVFKVIRDLATNYQFEKIMELTKRNVE